MHRSFGGKLLVASLTLSLLAALTTSPLVVGQEKGIKSKAKGRLPAYYKDVVTEAQRRQIYELQAKYSAQIDALEEQIQALTAQREQEIEGVLSPEQKQRLDKIRMDAANKRKKTPAAEAGDSTSILPARKTAA